MYCTDMALPAAQEQFHRRLGMRYTWSLQKLRNAAQASSRGDATCFTAGTSWKCKANSNHGKQEAKQKGLSF